MLVVKIGGDIIQSRMEESLLSDIRRIHESGGLILVHGGGDEVTRIAEMLGKEQRFIQSPSGIRSRYTDLETVQIYTMVMAGRVNKAVVRWLQSGGVPAVGLSGIDGALIRARRKKRLLIIDERGRKRIIEGGYTGKITEVERGLLDLLVENGYLPVVAPIAIGEEYEPLNVDSDRAAAHIAGAVGADRVIFLTDVQGVTLNGKLLERMTLKEAEEILPRMGAGMDKKVLASIEALKAGVKEAVICSGFLDEPITRAIEHKGGTVITLE
ncbi:acetylaminoadipate kinase [Candidatus Bathyarchaeota archaeon]|nr:MAG: acetylaminoadipate kinase [Candidatus Bathyarchaeota archaeon]